MAGTRIERHISKTDQPALAAGEPFHQNMKRRRGALPQHDRELFFPGIVTGYRTLTGRAGIPAVKQYPLACKNAALDDINQERGKA